MPTMAGVNNTPDLWELASALYLHGPNVDTLHTILPNWTKADITHVLRKFKSKAERERTFIQKGRKAAKPYPSSNKMVFNYESKGFKLGDGSGAGDGTGAGSAGAGGGSAAINSTEAALLKWSELLQKVQAIQGTSDKAFFGIRQSKFAPINDHSQLLSKVMLYSACTEDHYHGGHPEDTCYSEIYRYLSQLLAGEEPTQLRPRSAAKVLELLDRLTKVLSTPAIIARLPALRQLCLERIEKVEPSSSSDGDSGGAPAAPVNRHKTEPDISLFEDHDTTGPGVGGGGVDGSLEDACRALDPVHPYFEESRERVNSRLMSLQQATAASLAGVPGLNPLSLTPALMTKPLAAFSPTYPARLDSGESPGRPGASPDGASH